MKEKHNPTVGEHLYIYTPCSNMWVAEVRYPYTVESVKGNTMVIREAELVFYGARYYDTVADEIRDNPNGKRLTFRYSEKKNRWQESPAGSYPRVAVFGAWDHQPYLN